MGLLHKSKKKEETAVPEPPKLVSRKENRESTWKSGRTIGERREKLETASERAAEHKKKEKRKKMRLSFTVIGFAAAAVIAVWAFNFFFRGNTPENYSPTIEIPFVPTIEVIDEGASAGAEHITTRMKEYIGQAESDFRELGYTPVKAVVPRTGVREVDFYLDGHPGFIKLITDRGSGVSVEDADRMIRYLSSQGVTEYSYIDVRTDGKAYWK